MSQLNEQQRQAIKHSNGPMLVLAGAGTGKTRVITHRIANLIARGVSAERILGVTFTNKAADEMQGRLSKLLRGRTRNKPLICTFHSLCARILRRHAGHLGYPKQFAIYCGSEQEGLARSVLREISVADNSLSPPQLLGLVSRWKSQGLTPADAEAQAECSRARLAAAAYRRYQFNLKALGAVDFDDLLLLTEELFRKFDTVRAAESERFDQILIDEYQDTNNSQYRIVRALARRHQNLFVVGDDDQSIYGWRGAEISHILGFQNDWAKSKTIRLEDNYRSTHAILEFANRLIRFNKNRHEKMLRASRAGGAAPRIVQYPDETEEATETVASIQSRIAAAKLEPRDFAVLFRTNEQPRPFETALRRAKLPYVLIGGMSFFDRKEVQDVIAYLRLIARHADELPLLRILNRPPRGMGKAAVASLSAQSAKTGLSVCQILFLEHEWPGELPESARNGLRQLANSISTAQITAKKSLVDAITGLIRSIDYEREISRLYSDAAERESRWAGVQQIVNALGSYVAGSKRPELAEFLDQLVVGEIDPDSEKEKQLNRNAVALMTLHSAKGLEFPEVYLVGLEEGILPHQRSLDEGDINIEEERRLCYVGMTRAQERLTMSLALSRMKWGKARPSLPSRFLYEMSGKAEHPNYARAGVRTQSGRQR